MAGKEDDLDALALELGNDDYPLPKEKKESESEDKKQISYKNVDVTISFGKESEKDTETDEKRILYTDAAFEFDNLQFDEANGVLRVPIVVAKEMVYHYDDYDAFRSRDELKAIAPYIKGVPVTRGHPGAKIVTDRSEVLGWAVESKYEDDELRGVLEITDKSLIEDIQSGKLRGVSPGHFSRLDKTADGEFEGLHYDVIQRDIFVDHIAIVEEGRCSTEDGCGIMLDEEVKGKKKKEEDEERKMVSKTVLSKLDSALKLAEKLEDKTLMEKLEELKKALAEEAAENDKKQEGDGKEVAEEKEKLLDATVKKIEAERDGLKVELDAIVEEEKIKLIDELGALQEVKSEEQLKEMSRDALKNDLELVKALRGGKFTIDEKDKGGTGAIADAYKEVGKRGGKG